MANNRIQIKRSVSNGTVTGLSNGELAYTQVSNTLWIGLPDGSNTISIGGVRNPGTLTANQALVANSTSGIDRLYAANVDLSYLGANGSQGNSGFILFSGGSSTNAYWGSVGGLSINVNATYAWSNTQSFSNTITFNGPVVLGNTVSANGSVGIAGYALLSGGSGSNLYWSSIAGLGVNTAAQYSWSNTQLFTNTVTFSGNIALTSNISTQANSFVVFGNFGDYTNSLILTANGWGSTVEVGPSIALGWNSAGGGGAFAPAQEIPGNQTFVNTSLFFTGNTTQYIRATTGTVTLGNTGTVATVNSTIYTGTANNASYLGGTAAASYQLNSTLNANIASYLPNYAGVVNVSSLTISTFGSTTNGIIANSSFFGWGNSSANVTIAWDATGQDLFSIAGNQNNYVEAVIWNANSQTSASADFSINDNQGPYSNNYIDIGINSTGWSNTQWTINGPSDAYVYTGNTNLAVGTAGINQGNLVFFTGGTLASNERVRITAGGNVGINNTNPLNTFSVNGSTYLGGTLNVAGLSTFANATFTNMTVSGNLIVSGAVTTINTTSLTVADPIVEFGLGNELVSTDAVDTGWFSPANNTGTVVYSGIARIAAQSNTTVPYFKVFASTTNPNTATVIPSSTTGAIQAYLLPYGVTGAFIANSSVINITANNSLNSSIVANNITVSGFVATPTSVNITANASVSSALIANSLTLTTALAASYGGTGQISYSVGDLLYASGSTALSKLSIPGSAANGQVLMITNNLPAYGSLDGGTF